MEKDRIHRSDLVKMEILDKDKAMLRKHVDMLENQLVISFLNNKIIITLKKKKSDSHNNYISSRNYMKLRKRITWKEAMMN